MAGKRVTCKPDSGLLESGVGFGKEAWDHWTVEEMKKVISGDKTRIYSPFWPFYVVVRNPGLPWVFYASTMCVEPRLRVFVNMLSY